MTCQQVRSEIEMLEKEKEELDGGKEWHSTQVCLYACV